jgi:preprotein translocase subunit SecG
MFWTNFAIDVLLVVFVVACPLMWLVILMQRSKQEGLGAAFGGGFTESVWGAQTSNVLVKTTVFLASAFFIVSILLARLYTYQAHVAQKPSTLQQDLLRPVPMIATNAAGTPVVPTATPMPSAATATSSAPVTTGGSAANTTPAANAAPTTPVVPAKKP